jgi:hypothetical protein
MALGYDDAIAELSDMVAASTDPALSVAELRRLLRVAQVRDRDGNDPDTYAIWAATAAAPVGTEVVPTIRNGFAYRVTTAGTTGANEPAWPVVVDDQIADGTTTWTCVAVAAWLPSYDRMALNLAAAEGWRRKAGKLSDNETFSTDGSFVQAQLRRGDMMAMADKYRKKFIGSPALVGRVRQGIDDPTDPSEAELIDDLLWQRRVVNR